MKEIVINGHEYYILRYCEGETWYPDEDLAGYWTLLPVFTTQDILYNLVIDGFPEQFRDGGIYYFITPKRRLTCYKDDIPLINKYFYNHY